MNSDHQLHIQSNVLEPGNSSIFKLYEKSYQIKFGFSLENFELLPDYARDPSIPSF